MFRMLPSRVDSTLCVESVHDSVVWTLLCFWRFCFLAGAEEESLLVSHFFLTTTKWRENPVLVLYDYGII